MSRAHHLPEDPPRKDRSKPNARSAAHLGYGNITRRPALDGQIHLLAPDPRCWCPSLLHGSGSTRRTSGIPPTFAGSLAILFVLVPLEIGYLLYRGRRRNGRLSLAGVVRYRDPMPLWQFALFMPVLVFWYFTASSLWRPVESALAGTFSWVPSWVTDLVPSGDPSTHYPAAILLTVVVFQVVCSGVIAPVVEEVYFRSYLLPRIERLGLWAPVIGTVLFAFQHLWTPLVNPGRVIGWLPVVRSEEHTSELQS